MNLEKTDGTFVQVKLDDILSVTLELLDGVPVIVLTVKKISGPIYLKFVEPNLSLLNGLLVNIFSKKLKGESKKPIPKKTI